MAAAAIGIYKKVNVTRDIQPLRKKQDITISNLLELPVLSGHFVMNANYTMTIQSPQRAATKNYHLTSSIGIISS